MRRKHDVHGVHDVHRVRHRILRVLAAAFTVLAFAATTACSSPIGLPTSGAIRATAPVEKQTRRVYTSPEGPTQNDQPEGIVEGFFSAMPAGVQSDGYRVAREYLSDVAANTWNGDASAIIYDGTPTYTRKAIPRTSSAESAALAVEAEMNVIGRLDRNGLFTPAAEGDPMVLSFTMTKESGQWRISGLDDGVAVSSADFEQVFRQVSVHRVDASGKHLVPDVRWFSWRNWRTQAVRAVLSDGPAWLGGAVRDLDTNKVALAVDTVPMTDNEPQVQLNDGFLGLSSGERALIVHLIRLTLGDGVASAPLTLTVDGADYSDIDGGVDLDTQQPSIGIYTLTDGRVVSLGSSSPLRVGETRGFGDARGFAFSASGGAVLRADGVVECLKPDASSCGVMFSGAPMSSIASGLDGEIWAVSADGRSLHVSRGGVSRELKPQWLGDETIRAVAVSPEGARLAVATDGGVRLAGVSRDDGQTPSDLSSQSAKVSGQGDVTMVTFYNDLNLVYATSASQSASSDSSDDATQGRGAGRESTTDGQGAQKAFRQIAPGPATSQRLPDTTVVALASGQIALYRRLAVLDDLGIVRSVSGSLDGSWSIADSQVTALGAQ